MASSMNDFDFDYPATTRDDSQGAHDGSVQPSLATNDPSLIDFSHGYDFGSLLPQDLSLPSFDRPGQHRGDLEGRLSNVMLTYDSIPSTGAPMPMTVDPGSAFAYPATSMGLLSQLDQPQLQSTFPFTQSLSPANQYIQPQNPPQSREDPYNNTNHNNNYTTSGSTGSYDDSDFSRASDRSQVPMPRPSQRILQYGQPASFPASQPVAIQPKKPVVKGECCADKQEPSTD